MQALHVKSKARVLGANVRRKQLRILRRPLRRQMSLCQKRERGKTDHPPAWLNVASRSIKEIRS